jgi:hypothetical protein
MAEDLGDLGDLGDDIDPGDGPLEPGTETEPGGETEGEGLGDKIKSGAQKALGAFGEAIGGLFATLGIDALLATLLGAAGYAFYEKHKLLIQTIVLAMFLYAVYYVYKRYLALPATQPQSPPTEVPGQR